MRVLRHGRSLSAVLLATTIFTFQACQAQAQTSPVTITGTGTPGDTLYVLRDGTNVGTVTVSSGGTWSFSDSATAGVHTYTAYQASAAGNWSWISANGVQLSVGTTPCGTAITEPPPFAAGTPATIITSTAPGVPVQMNTNVNVYWSNYNNPPTYGYWIVAGNKQLGSAAVPGATVAVYLGAALVGYTVADQNGAWSITTTVPGSSNFRIYLQQTTKAGTSPLSALAGSGTSADQTVLWVPSITMSPASGNVPTGGTITAKINIGSSLSSFNPVPAPVTVPPNSSILLNSGDNLTYVSGSGTATLTYAGVVNPGRSTSGLTFTGWVNPPAGIELLTANAQFPGLTTNWPDPTAPVVTCAH